MLAPNASVLTAVAARCSQGHIEAVIAYGALESLLQHPETRDGHQRVPHSAWLPLRQTFAWQGFKQRLLEGSACVMQMYEQRV